MGMTDHGAMVAKIGGTDGYGPYFEEAFGDPEITLPTYPYEENEAILINTAQLTAEAAAWCAKTPSPADPVDFYLGALPLRAIDRLAADPFPPADWPILMGYLYLSGYFGGVWLREDMSGTGPGHGSSNGGSGESPLGSFADLAASTAEMTGILDGMRQRGLAFVDRHFRLRLRAPGLDSDVLRQEFDDEVVGRSLGQLNDIANDYVNAQVDSNRR